MKELLFIINPISGGKDKHGFPELVHKYLDKNRFSFSCCFTEYAGHAHLLAKAAVETNKYYAVVAVGGDGTINEVASALVHTPLPMGIIPCGSGNGLALSLGLSLDNCKALSALNDFEPRAIDAATVNGEWFFNMAGMGFDAHISHAFAAMEKRGFAGYIKTSVREVLKYTPYPYEITIDGKRYDQKAFMVSIANSPQYGNNAIISPTASLTDGLLDVCIVKPFALWRFPYLVLAMFAKKGERTSYLDVIKGKNIRIVSFDNPMIHLDGEPKVVEKEILINIEASAILILC